MIFGLRVGSGEFRQHGWIAPIVQFPERAGVQRYGGRQWQSCPGLTFGDRPGIDQHCTVPALGIQASEGGKEGIAANVSTNTCHVPVTCKPSKVPRYRGKATSRVVMTVIVLSLLDEARGGLQASGLASYADPPSLNGFAIRRITLLATSPPTSFQLSSERGRRFLLTSTLPSGGKASLFLLVLFMDCEELFDTITRTVDRRGAGAKSTQAGQFSAARPAHRAQGSFQNRSRQAR
jgi:hypothetical protein